MLQTMGLLMRLDPIQSQQIGQETLGKKMAANDPLGDFLSIVGQMNFLAAIDRNVTFTSQTTQRREHRRRRHPGLGRDASGDHRLSLFC